MIKKSNHQSSRKVRAFFLLTFFFSWSIWSPFVLAGFGVIELSKTLASLMTPAIMLGAFAPLLAAITLIARRSGWSAVRQYFRQAFSLQVKARYIALAVLIPLLITAAAHYIANSTGLDSLPDTLLPKDLPVPAIILIIPCFLLMLVAGGGQEEFGWRGYAQEPLQERFGIFRGSLLLGVVWGVWHLPLWFMPGEGHSYYPFVAFLIYITSTALIMGWLYNASGRKLVIPWIIHAMGNMAVPFFPIMHMTAGPQPGYWVWVGLNALVAMGITIWFWRKRNDILLLSPTENTDKASF